MIVWGGTGPTPRMDHTTVWTGKEMIIWGGMDDNFVHLQDIHSYDPYKNEWRLLNSTNNSRALHTAVWSGLEVIVWGGSFSGSQGQKLSVADTNGYCGGYYHTTCYSDSQNPNYARHIGSAVTMGGQEVIYARNKNGVMIWKDIYSDRILSHSLRGWHTNDHEGVSVQNFNTVRGIECKSFEFPQECEYIF
jgi:hypothetical protein